LTVPDEPSGHAKAAALVRSALHRAFLLPLLVTAVTGAVLLAQVHRLRSAILVENNIDGELRSAEELQDRLLRADVDLRGYLLNGQSHWLAALGRSRREIVTRLQDLEGLPRRYTRVFAALETYSGAIREWADHEVLIEAERVQAAGAIEASRLAEDERKLGRVQASFAELSTALDENLGTRRADVRRRLVQTLGLVAALSVAAGVGIAFYIRRGLREVSRAFGAVLSESEEANRLKAEFLALVSHELRTPINAVLGWTALLRRRHTDPTLVRRAIETIDRNAHRQARLVDDVVDLSSIAAGQLMLEPDMVEVEPTLSAVASHFQPIAQGKGVRLHVETTSDIGTLWADRQRLHQILERLVENAIKFTPRGGDVEVTARRAESFVEILVKDTGRGIEHDFVPRVFDPFWQADGSTARAGGGLGLGLTIVRRLVELQGGFVYASSAGAGAGATFVVLLPVSSEQRSRADARSEGHLHRSRDREA
jgi:signal transduction histidine kinase